MEIYERLVELLTAILAFYLAYAVNKTYKRNHYRLFRIFSLALIAFGVFNFIDTFVEFAFELEFDTIALHEWAINIVLFVLILALRPVLSKTKNEEG